MTNGQWILLGCREMLNHVDFNGVLGFMNNGVLGFTKDRVADVGMARGLLANWHSSCRRN